MSDEGLGILTAILNEERFKIMLSLENEGKMHASEMVMKIFSRSMKLPALLYHLRILENKGLIARDSARKYYLTEKGIKVLRALRNLEITEGHDILFISDVFPYVQNLDTEHIENILKKDFPFVSFNILQKCLLRIKQLGLKFVNLDILRTVMWNILAEDKSYSKTEPLRALSGSTGEGSAIIIELLEKNSSFIDLINHINFANKNFLHNKFLDAAIDFELVSNGIEGTGLLRFSLGFHRNLVKLSNHFINFNIKKFESILKIDPIAKLSDDELMNFFSEFFRVFSFMSSNISFSLDCSSLNEKILDIFLNPMLYLNHEGKSEGPFLSLALSTSLKQSFGKIKEYLSVIPLIILNRSEDLGKFSHLGFYNAIGKSHKNWLVELVISLDLPSIVLKSKFSENALYDKLYEAVLFCKEALRLKRAKISGLKEMHDIERIAYLNLIGIFEAVFLLTNNTILETSSRKALTKLLSHLLKMIGEEGENILLSSINDGESPKIFAMKDLNTYRRLIPKQLKASLRIFGYSTGCFPSWISFSNIEKRLRMESFLGSFLKGGHDIGVMLNFGELEKEIAKVIELSLSKYKLKRVMVKSKLLFCNNCREYFHEEFYNCPKCGSKLLFVVFEENEIKFLPFEEANYFQTKIID